MAIRRWCAKKIIGIQKDPTDDTPEIEIEVYFFARKDGTFGLVHREYQPVG
jgi:hypothetical protein